MNRLFCRATAAQAPLALLLILSAGCRSGGSENRVNLLIDEGEYREAVVLAAELAEESPDDPEVDRTYRRAVVSNLLDVGRRATFADDDLEALEYFYAALEVAPGNRIVESWIDKTKKKLAARWLDTAYERNNSNDLAGAREAFQKVLEWVPDNPNAREGEAAVILREGWRAGLGEAYYTQGVRALKKAEFVRAKQNLGYAQKYVSDDEKTLERMRAADAALGQERVEIARQFAKDGLFNAAKNEFRLALLLDPENVEAKQSFDSMAREARADVFLDEADMHMRRGNLEEALQALEYGKNLSVSQGERFDAMWERIENARLKKLYDRAYSYEVDYEYESAVEAYDVLLAEANVFEDAEERRAMLAGYIERAASLYAEAAAADDDESRRELLLQIDAFWPEYLDLEEQLKALASAED